MKLTSGIVAILFSTLLLPAQTPNNGVTLRFTATTDNVSGAHDSIKIDLMRWSADAERDQLIQAWTNPAPAPAPAGGRGRGGAAAADGGGDAAAGRGGRGGGRGGRGGAPAPPQTPEDSLAAALVKSPVVGYLWSSEVAGYAVHYAVKLPEPNGGERIVFVTDRRLGENNDAWKPVSGEMPSPYGFSVIELRLNGKGEGEGKASITGKVNVDAAAKTFALENYAALPVILKNLRRR